MTMDNIALFQGIGAKMDFLNQRQRVISQNIANTDTPSYKPHDVVKPDFSKVLKGVADKSRPHVGLETTNEGHLPPPGIGEPRNDEQDKTYEVAPVGNAVIMEEQLLNSNQTVADYNLMTNLMRKNVGLIQTALGRQQ